MVPEGAMQASKECRQPTFPPNDYAYKPYQQLAWHNNPMAAVVAHITYGHQELSNWT